MIVTTTPAGTTVHAVRLTAGSYRVERPLTEGTVVLGAITQHARTAWTFTSEPAVAIAKTVAATAYPSRTALLEALAADVELLEAALAPGAPLVAPACPTCAKTFAGKPHLAAANLRRHAAKCAPAA